MFDVGSEGPGFLLFRQHAEGGAREAESKGASEAGS